jgi:AAA15 family ATPase/GTPase
MLLRFNVDNFLSFKENVNFSLIANRERRKSSHYIKNKGVNILKTSIIYGANASGKSNLIKAIYFSQKVILKGLDKLDTTNLHYRLDDNNIDKPTIFNYEIKTNKKFYSYGFALHLNKGKILEEWLFEIVANKEKMIFERFVENNEHKIEIGLKLNKYAKTRFDVYNEDFKSSDTILFLSEINRKSIADFPEAIDFKNVYDWFDNKLTVLFPNSKYAGLNFIGDDNTMATVFNKFLNVFQTGISDIISEEINIEQFDIPKMIKEDLVEKLKKQKTILFEINGITYSLRKTKKEYKIKKIGLEHITDKGDKIVFDFDNESDGTQRLFDFIPALYSMTKSDYVFIIDELDRSLHSKLTYGIVELFLDLSKNNESQLIATTHESLLLDLNLLRRDEIWFVEKIKNSSKLFSLDEFKVRNDKIVRKDYLLGRYGAIPIFKSFKNIKLEEWQVD